jgi:hypothetical protein
VPTGGAAPTAGAGSTPPGYWTSGSYKGCVWTGVDAEMVGSTITPQDFTMKAPGGPYCVSGTVGAHPEYESVSLLGFNLAEPETASCVYKPVDPNAPGPPAVTFPGTATGIALNFAKNKASTLRVQIQGPNGAKDENDRWCYTVTGAGGKVFAPFTEFNTQCWNGKGNAYKGEPISAVVFSIPGDLKATEFDYCINGFTPGTSAADAPDGGATGGVLTGTIGGPGARDLDFQRVKVSAGNKSYIIQNNNWGNPEGTDQTISYKGNSFTITGETGAGNTSGAPASFPSIYIGGNGNVANGAFSTRSDDGLPKQISQITSVMSTFKYNRASGGYNATYDIWFSASPPTAEYTDAISGFVMLWLYDPSNAQPIGSVQGTYTGAGGTWDVWVGPRGGSGSNANAPVVSFVNKSNGTLSFTGDLKPFFVEAGKYGLNQSWYLTDVFGGFEIWNGGGTNGLAVTEFTAVVQ